MLKDFKAFIKYLKNPTLDAQSDKKPSVFKLFLSAFLVILTVFVIVFIGAIVYITLIKSPNSDALTFPSSFNNRNESLHNLPFLYLVPLLFVLSFSEELLFRYPLKSAGFLSYFLSSLAFFLLLFSFTGSLYSSLLGTLVFLLPYSFKQFRSFLKKVYTKYFSFVFYFFASFFSFLHIFNYFKISPITFVFIIPQFLLGLYLGYLFKRYGLLYSFLYHFFFNFSIFLLTFGLVFIT